MPATLREPVLDRITRRRLLTGAGALGALGLVTACGGAIDSATGASPASGTGGFPLSVEHRNGTTRIPAAPQRVVTVGYSDQDPVLALGVRPFGVTDWYGDHPYATWPWAQDELGDAQPVVMNRGTFTGTPEYRYEEIAAMAPDLIIGLYTGMDATQYETLSRIAPTVGPPAGFPEWGGAVAGVHAARRPGARPSGTRRRAHRRDRRPARRRPRRTSAVRGAQRRGRRAQRAGAVLRPVAQRPALPAGRRSRRHDPAGDRSARR
ncbi:hypothetical protein GCM10009610_61510 [Pseudonocardia xinjiangensis]